MGIYSPSVAPVVDQGPSNPPWGREGVLDLQRQVIREARRRGLLVSDLGRAGEYPLLHVHPKDQAVLLVAGGTHGNEIGGSLGILRWLQTRPEPKVPVAFLPLVNPTGAERGTRDNVQGEDPNRGFYSDRPADVSAEGVALLTNLEYLMPREAFLTLHEAAEGDGYFQATFEDYPSKLTTALLITGVKWFGLEQGLLEYEGKKDTFEDYLYRQGLHRAVCSEVPSRYGMEDRAACMVELIDAAIEACVV